MKAVRIIATILSSALLFFGLYLLTIGLFMRIAYAGGFYWGTPPVPIPAWYYIPEYVITNLPWIVIASIPLALLYRHQLSTFVRPIA